MIPYKLKYPLFSQILFIAVILISTLQTQAVGAERDGYDKQINTENLAKSTTSEAALQSRREEREKQYITCRGITSSGNDFSQKTISNNLSRLPAYKLPSRLPMNCIYMKDPQGNLHIMQRFQTYGFKFLEVYGPSEEKINWVTNYSLYHETFAHTQQNTNKDSRYYPITYPTGSGVERGHGIDFADTIPQNHSSNDSPLNYIPQSNEYNSKFRRVFVAEIRKNGGMYGEIALFSPTSQSLTQKIKKKHSLTGNPTSQSILIPEGFIFKVFSPYSKKCELYLFPNQLNYSGLVSPAISYVTLAEKYKITNAEQLLTPLIYDRSKNIQETRRILSNWFLLALNLGKISPFSYIRVPYRWDSSLGFETSNLNNEGLSPFFGENIKEEHRKLFLDFCFKKLLEESGKYEFTTIELRLTLIALYTRLFKDEKRAQVWVDSIHNQINTLSFIETLNFFITFTDNFHTPDPKTLTSITAVLKSKEHEAPLEDRLEADKERNHYSHLNELSGLNTIRSVTPQNSNILREENAKLPDITTLVTLLEKTSNLEEVSLKGISISIPPKYLRFSIEGDNFSYSPLKEIFSTLEKSSLSLKKLDLSNITLNGDAIGNHLYQALSEITFPSLEYLDLSDLGITGDSYPRLNSLIRYRNLKILNLDRNPLSQRAMDDVLTVMGKLPQLNISATNITSPSLESFSENIPDSIKERIKFSIENSYYSEEEYLSSYSSEDDNDAFASEQGLNYPYKPYSIISLF